MIHTATVHIVSFGILAHGFSLDIPFLCHAQIVSAQINLVIGAEIFCVVGVGFGATVPTRLVYDQIFILRCLLSDGPLNPPSMRFWMWVSVILICG